MPSDNLRIKAENPFTAQSFSGLQAPTHAMGKIESVLANDSKVIGHSYISSIIEVAIE